MSKARVGERTLYIGMAVFFGLMLLVGTFFDEAISAMLFTPGNVPATLITTLGIYPFSAAMVLFMGVAWERVIHSKMATVVKILLSILFMGLALYVGFSGAKSLLDVDCLGGIFPSLDGNYPVILVVSLLFEWSMFYVGFRLANGSDDALLLRKVVALLIVMIVAYLAMKVLKGVFNRPRYRTVAMGYEGIDFVPWYTISPDPSDLMAKYGLGKDEFYSFPSGHAILSTSIIYILYSFAWLFPKLKERKLTLCVAGFVFATVVMFTRMVLGAHYLSDVSMGALIALLCLAAYCIVQGRIDKNNSIRSRAV